MGKPDKKKSRFISCKNCLRFVFGVCAFLGAADLLMNTAISLAAYFVAHSGFSVSETASIGIIGGADGPTSILVVSPPWTAYIFPVLLIIVGLFGCYCLSKKTGK